MRTLCYLALPLAAVAAFAADTPGEPQSFKLQPGMEWKAPARAPDGRFQFRTLPNLPQIAGRVPREALEQSGPARNTCYSIRSYVVKRVDGTDETVPSGMTTCTPATGFQLRRSAPRK